MQPTIAFLGIGLMGGPMTENLISSGYSMRLWNRTRSKADRFEGRATIADSPAEAAKGADIVITMLETGAVVNQVLLEQGVLSAMAPGTLFVDMSSIPPAMAKAHAQAALDCGVAYIDAPVSGGTLGAEKATLSIMAGGEASDIERVETVFKALGRVTRIGPAGSGQLAKLANQAIVGITIGAVAEALLLAAKGGADPAAVREALLGGFASSRILELHGQRMLDRAFVPGATARVQHKDLTMITDEARASGLTLPLAERVFEEYQGLLDAGLEQVDHSGLLLYLEQINGYQLGTGAGAETDDV